MTDLRTQLYHALRGSADPGNAELDALALADLDKIMPVLDRYIAWRQQIWEQSLIYALEAQQETQRVVNGTKPLINPV